MTNEPRTSPDAADADVLEQEAVVTGGSAPAADTTPDLPVEANEADVIEQHQTHPET